jgi:hypothetical protein
MNQQHQDSENSEPLRSQRMTEDEACAVIGLWQQEQTDNGGLTTSPAVPDVAEGLDIAVEDVQRLLAQVRAQREDEENLLTLEQWQAELEQIRLDEEERKLAEIRRQRAELQRQQAKNRRRADIAPLSSSFYLEPPTSEEMAEVARRQTAERRESGKLIFIMVIVMILLSAFGLVLAFLASPH